MDMRGHNSSSYGETLREQIETILSDDHETTFRYAQWHIGDYITGTMGMQLEQEGAYIRFLMRLYQRGKPLPDDDRFMATCMNLSLRVWKRIRDALISVGKIIAKAGCLTNARFEKERQLRAETIQKQAEAARLRWAKQRAEKMGLAEVSAKFAGSLDETSPKLFQSTEENINEINGSFITDHMLTNNQYPLTIKEEPPIVPLQGDDSARKRRSSIPEQYPEGFESFWSLYPRKVGKGGALKAWGRLTIPQRRKAYVALKAQLSWLNARAHDPQGNFCPHPATWLNDGRFDDEPVTQPAEQKPADMPDFIWESAQRAKREAMSS